VGYIENWAGSTTMMEVMTGSASRPSARRQFAVAWPSPNANPRRIGRAAPITAGARPAYIRDHGSITNREYRALCQGVSAETLRLDLSDMVEKGILLKVGSKKGTYYILK
jgi:hypothetical protein